MVPSIALNLVRLASRRTLPTLHHSLIPSLSTLPLTSNPLYSLRTFTTKPTESSNKPLSGSDEAPDGAMEPIMPDPVEGEVVTSERVKAICDQVLELNIIELTQLTALFQDR